MSVALFQATDVVCERGGRALFQAVHLELHPGTSIHLTGDNGAGKTTLLRALSGLSPLAQGQVWWRGQATAEARPAFHADLLYLGHALGLKDELTALENLQLGAALSGQTLAPSQALDALTTQGLKNRAHLPLKVLSQGQKRRVALARLQVVRAKLWLLDEPFVALDTDAVQVLHRLLRSHLDQGGALLFTSHQAVSLGSSMQHLRLQA
jgi:heme exporter protein A